MTWPTDSDGDVFRRMEASGFDFSREHSIDFNIDFEKWPPPQAALDLLQAQYGNVEIFNPDERGAGYVLFRIVARASYELVTSVQRNATSAMQPYGGVCETWGVLF